MGHWWTISDVVFRAEEAYGRQVQQQTWLNSSKLGFEEVEIGCLHSRPIHKSSPNGARMVSQQLLRVKDDAFCSKSFECILGHIECSTPQSGTLLRARDHQAQVKASKVSSNGTVDVEACEVSAPDFDATCRRGHRCYPARQVYRSPGTGANVNLSRSVLYFIPLYWHPSPSRQPCIACELQ